MEPKDRLFFAIIVLTFLIISLRLWHLQIFKGEQYSKLAEQNRIRVIKIPAPRGIIYDRNGIPLVENVPSFTVSISPDYAQSVNIELLSKILNLSKEEIESKLNRKTESQFVPIRLKEDLTKREIAMLEANRTEIPGLTIEIEMKRHYTYEKATSHLIGYLGQITEEQIKINSSLRDLPPYFRIGQIGLEYRYDDELRGRAGEKVVEVDALGRELRLIKETPPVKGKDIYLTIDAFLQEAAYKALENYNGAFIAVNPNTGEILAMVSTPSFDPNLFVDGVPSKYWSQLVNDPRHPLLNKVIQGVYPPGSTFKVVTALAGLEEGLILSDRILVNCKGSLSIGKWTFGCWRKEGHGQVNLKRAIIESCDVYFYELGKLVGIENIHKYATKLGLGNATGFSPEEKPGLVPNSDWKIRAIKTTWYLGDTFNTAIGQGFLKVTPLQMALVMATIVNGGTKYRPYILRDSKPEGIDLGLNKKNLDIIKEALISVVNEPNGTAWGAKSSLIKFGGKTGTVQVVSKKLKEKIFHRNIEHHAWFVGFAPADKPEIAFAVIVEHGGAGGAVAAPVAKSALEGYILKKRQLNVEN